MESENPQPEDAVPEVSRPTFLALLREAVTFRVAVGTAITFGLGVGTIALSYLPWFSDPTTSWFTFAVRQVGSGLVVATIAGLIVRLFVERYREKLADRLEKFLKKDVTADLNRIRADIGLQAQLLISESRTLEAVASSGADRAYKSRGDAVPDMRADVEESDAGYIRLMGISLNDFLRADQSESLHSVWKLITSYVRGEHVGKGKLDIRILIIDPNCEGALLRSYGESREDDQLAGRLDEDVTSTARRLRDLLDEKADGTPRAEVSFDFRLYRLPPTIFLLSTTTVSYAQPYYFWSRRQFEISMPLLRLEGSALHRAMHDHFDLIWDHASVDGAAWLRGFDIGIDRGALEAGLVNVFSDSRAARSRMCWLLANATGRVWLQGVSLKSFFEFGDLHAALLSAMARPEVDIRVLLLDPGSEQAHFRSFREHEFADHCDRASTQVAEYLPGCHEDSALVRDTRATLNRITRLARDNPRIRARLYRTAPSCFMLIVDDKVLVEQYHYGKTMPVEFAGHGTPPILGKDMALFEYARSPQRGFMDLDTLDVSRNSYELLADHFGFVFERCAQEEITVIDLATAETIGEPQSL